MPTPSGRRPTWLAVTALGVAVACLAPLGSALKQAADLRAEANGRLPRKIPRPGSGGIAARTTESTPAFPVRSWQVPADLLEHLSDAVKQEHETPAPDPFGPPTPWRADSVQQALHLAGVPFPRDTWAVHDPYLGTLEACHESDGLEQIDTILTRLGPLPQWTIDRSLFDPGPSRRRLSKGPETDYTLIEQKLRSIILPEVEFEDATLGEAVAFLNQAAVEHDRGEPDPQRRGLEITIKLTEPGGYDVTQIGIRDLRLEDASVVTVLQYMCAKTSIRYATTPEGVTVFTPYIYREPIETMHWKVAPELIEHFRGRRTTRRDYDRFFDPDPFAEDPVAIDPPLSHEAWVREVKRRPLVDLFKDAGISFPEGTKVEYSPASSRLTLVNTPSNLDLFEVLFEGMAFDLSKERFEASRGR